MELLTSFNVDVIGCILLAGKHSDYDSIITIFDELLDLFRCLYLLGGRPSLLTHIVNNPCGQGGRHGSALLEDEKKPNVHAVPNSSIHTTHFVTYHFFLWVRCIQTPCPS